MSYMMAEVTMQEIERSVDVITGKIPGATKAELEAMEKNLRAFFTWFINQDMARCRVINKIGEAQNLIHQRKMREK